MRIAPWFPCLFLMAALFLGSLGLQAQNFASIANPNLTGAPVCAGSAVTINFEVRNGNNGDYFTLATNYTAVFGKLNVAGNLVEVFSIPFTSESVPPSNSNQQRANISHIIIVPENIPGGIDYRVAVEALSPNASRSNVSDPFEIKSRPAKPITTGGLICIGSTATLSASGAVAGESYKWYNVTTGGTLLKTSTNNSDNTYVTAVISATTNYWVSILNSNGCESTRTIVTATFPSNSPDSQFTTVTDTWVGHVYDGTNIGVAFNGNFTNYFGTVTEAETFDQNFGGDNICFPVSSSLGSRSIYTETFSIRYRMNSTKKGLYVVDLGSDDGSRLTVDGTLLYNNWSDQGWVLRPRALMNLTGTSQLVYDFYENASGNRVNFNNLIRILENKLTGNIDQNVCSGTTAAAISGDTFGTLPAGLSAAGYQWNFSISLGGTRNNIAGATSASFTPNINAAPFNNPGTYYIFRNASLSSVNNVNPNPYVATNESNPAILTVKSKPNAPTVSNNGPVCVGLTLNLFASTVAGATYNWTGPNGFTSTLQNPSRTNASVAMAGTYTVTSTVNGCTSVGASTDVIVNTTYNWTGNTNSDWNTASNWACNSIPNLNLDVIIPGGLTNYPILNPGTMGMAKAIQINSGATLIIIDNTLQIAGSVSNSGTFNSLNGSVAFVGAVAQTIPANTFLANRIRNLIINNPAGVSSSGNLEITGFLRVENGNFDTGNALSLISDATQTAFIDGSGNGQVVGLVKMQRYMDVAFGYKYFSSPFSNSTVGDFSLYVDLNAKFPQVYYYDENSTVISTDGSANDITGWKSYTNAASGLGTLEGYAFNFGTAGTAVTVELNGTVNNGPFTRPLSNNNGTYTKGFNLVGNPYPSPIDWNAAGWTKTNIDDALYFFTAGTDQYTGTYSSFIGATSSDGKSSNIIPSMQGFFVHVTDTGTYPVNGTLGMSNEVRTNNYTQEFLKVKEPEKPALIRITAAFENEVNTDPAVIYFPDFAELSFEKDKDALKLMNTDVAVPNLYSLTPENKKLSINALPKPGSNDVKKIPLGLKTEKDGWMLIGLKDLENLPSNFNVYLIDSEKRIGQNLSRKPQYRFYATSGEHESRFHLMFSETELRDPAIAFDEPFSVRTVGGKVMVSLNLELGQSGVLLASTVTGQILDRKNVSEKEIIEIEGIKSSGVYFISINLKDGMFSKKVLIQK